jgi:hypothetical protein
MTDIVERLEHYAKLAMPHYPNDLCSEAKREIERLQAIIAHCDEKPESIRHAVETWNARCSAESAVNKWVTAAVASLNGYERDCGESLPDDHEIGRIEESRDTPSFRLRVGHIRQLETLLAALSDPSRAEPQAAPSDIERAFRDACDEAGCAYDNEALLEAIHALKERSQAESAK